MFPQPCFPPSGRFSLIFQSQRNSSLLYFLTGEWALELVVSGPVLQSSCREIVLSDFYVHENQLGSLLIMQISWSGVGPGNLPFNCEAQKTALTLPYLCGFCIPGLVCVCVCVGLPQTPFILRLGLMHVT